MRKALLVITAILSSALGGVVVYMVMTVPNDIQSDALLKTARMNLERGDRAKARAALIHIVQQYPRTDAAAAATAALIELAAQEQKALRDQIAAIEKEHNEERETINRISGQLTELSKPAPAPPPAAKAAPKKPTAPKAAAKKRTTRRRHR